LFVNMEPATVARLGAAQLAGLTERLPPGTHPVLEVTERALLRSPAQLLAGVDVARELGWMIALDDVGAERSSLALVPFLRPDVIKLDLRVIQRRASLETAEVVHAVAAYVERTNAVLVAEGVETPLQRDRAAALGATFLQGWLTGRPGPLDGLTFDGGAPPIAPRRRMSTPVATGVTPFEALASADLPVRRTTKPLLAMLSAQLERQALQLDELTVVTSTFQHARHFAGRTRRRYEALARTAALVTVAGVRMPAEPGDGVRGVAVDPDHRLSAGWCVAVVGPHFAAVLTAQPTEDASGAVTTADGERQYDYVLSYDRTRAVLVADMLLRCDTPRAPAAGPSADGDTSEPPLGRAAVASSAVLDPGAGPPRGRATLPDLLTRAIATAVNPITIADATAPDMPLIYANEAFLRMTGYAESEVLGRNCRFLQGEGTDPVSVRPIGRLLAAGRAAHAVLLNYRRDGSPFFNEVTMSPVYDDCGNLTHFIGNQIDVTERVRRQRTTAYLAYHDPLVGLPNRVQLTDHLELELARARRTGGRLAVLYADLDGFKAVNDTSGHARGDAALREVAQRFSAAVREGDLLTRLGGDEFAVVLTGLAEDAAEVATRVGRELRDALAETVADGHQVGVSVGIALYPDDGEDADALLARADAAMFRAKHAGGGRIALRGAVGL
ncbi:MAG TPA: diguanylate cyclase, partial [Solirubrobacteraceae bacterium]|nr:diguanylate cyclase [Solirubrobacteraceae bacterium]